MPFNISRPSIISLISHLRNRPKFRQALLICLAISPLLLIGWASYSYWQSPLPTLTLNAPKENEDVFTDTLYLRGTVSPLGSKVLVNNQSVSLNGDGSFTAILKIKEGENTLRLTAKNRSKSAEVLRLVQRKLTPEEQRAKQEAEAKETADARAKILSQNQEIAQVQAAYSQKEAKKVRVAEQELKTDHGLKRVVGKIVNDTDGAAYWVKVTATFLDQAGRPLETKMAFVTSFEKFLKPQETAQFETQSAEKDFDHYQLDVTWEKE